MKKNSIANDDEYSENSETSEEYIEEKFDEEEDEDFVPGLDEDRHNDENEDDIDSDFDDISRPKRKKRKTKHQKKKNRKLDPKGEEERRKAKEMRNFFLAEEAEVDEAGTDEDELSEEEGFIDHDKPIQHSKDDIEALERYHRLQRDLRDKSVEEIAADVERRTREMFEQRYGTDLKDDFELPLAQDLTSKVIETRSLLPKVQDPKLFMVHCRIGREKELLISLLKKHFWILKSNQIKADEDEDEEVLQITGAVAPEHLKGFVFIEAFKVEHVRKAIEGLNAVVYTKTLAMLPNVEMPDVLKVTKTRPLIQAGDFVRVKRGLYKGDLGQVMDLEDSRSRMTIRIVPRLNLVEMSRQEGLEGRDAPEDTNTLTKRKRSRMIPPPKFFNPEEIIALGLQMELIKRHRFNQDEYYFKGNKYVDGFLIKSMNSLSLQVENIQPTLDELQAFKDHLEGGKKKGRSDNDNDDDDDNEDEEEENDDNENEGTMKKLLPASTRQSNKMILNALEKVKLTQGKNIDFSLSEKVQVIRGPTRNLVGTVVKMSKDGSTYSIKPSDPEFTDLLDYFKTDLIKYFSLGEHVQVLRGKHNRETGMIIRVDGDVITILSDITNKEFEVFRRDLKHAVEVQSGIARDPLGKYAIHDMVLLHNNTQPAVILKITGTHFKVIDHNSRVVTLPMADIGPVRRDRSAQTFDSNQQTLNIGDSVVVTSGANQGRRGEVIHIFQFFCFVQSREIPENQGIIAERSSVLALEGSKAAQVSKLSTGFKQMSQFSPFAVPPPKYLLSPDRQAVLDRREVSKHCTIIRGPYKGYSGFIKSATDKFARIEIQANCKVVSVPREHYTTSEDKLINNRAMERGTTSGDRLGAFHSTPNVSATPFHGGDFTMTPGRFTPGKATPDSHDPWNANATNTPAHHLVGTPYNDFPGASTPYNTAFGNQSSTPYNSAFGAQGSTPHNSAFGAQGSTPFNSAFGAQGSTPHNQPFPESSTPSSPFPNEVKLPESAPPARIKFCFGCEIVLKEDNKPWSVMSYEPDGDTYTIKESLSGTVRDGVALNKNTIQPYIPKMQDCVMVVNQELSFYGKHGSVLSYNDENDELLISLSPTDMKIVKASEATKFMPS